MNNLNGRVAALLCAVGCATGVVWAGDLNPPMGPIAPTMKSLDDIEPRKCLNMLPGDEGAAHVITEGGSYFLTGDISSGQGQSAIRVATTQDVSIDLNGFTMRCAPGAVAHAIEVSDFGLSRVHISNGTVSSPGGDGIRVEGAHDVVLQNVRCVSCPLGAGMRFVSTGGGGAGGAIYISDCVIRQCGEGLVSVDTPLSPGRVRVLTRLHVEDCAGVGIDVAHGSLHLSSSSVRSCGGTGISVADLDRDGALDVCSVSSTGGHGVFVSGSSGTMRLSSLSIESTTLHGLSLHASASPIHNTMDFSVGELYISLAGQNGVDLAIDQDARCRWMAPESLSRRVYSSGGRGMSVSCSSSAHLRCVMSSMVLSNSALEGMLCTFGNDASISMDCDDMHFSGNGDSGVRTFVQSACRCRMSWSSCSSSSNIGRGWSIDADPSSLCDVGWSSCSATDCDGDGFACSFGGGGGGGRIAIRCLDSFSNRCGGRGFDLDCDDLSMESCSSDLCVSGACRITGRGTVATGKIETCAFSGSGGNGLELEFFDCMCLHTRCSDNSGHGLVLVSGSLTVQGGMCVSNGGSGVFYGGGGGAGKVSMLDLRCSSNGEHGVHVTGARCECVNVTCDRNTLTGMTCSSSSLYVSSSSCVENLSHGMCLTGSSSCEVSRSEMRSNGGHGLCSDGLCRVSSSSCSSNGIDGISMFAGGSLEMSSSMCSNNSRHGVRCVDASCRADSSSCPANTTDGWNLLSASCRLTECDATGNGGNGFFSDSSSNPTVTCGPVDFLMCVASGNGSSGISVQCGVGGSVSMCRCDGNGVRGVWLSSSVTSMRVEGNSCSENFDTGLQVDGQRCVVIRNSATVSPIGVGIVISQGNAAGPIIDAVGVGIECNNNANIVH